ncbi:MAG TPA: ABC transporter permease, partial [Thermoanaerobaculia bacterium]|nr:ABC transporter permease [Thermoanaerobaculia bacterium]
DQARSFEAVAGYTLSPRNLTGVENPERVPVASVSPAFFRVLAARPAHGRAFQPEEEEPAKALVAVLSHEAWQRRFGADPNALGRTIDLDGQRYTVVGVMPPGFRSPGKLEPWGYPELWVPEVIDRANLAAERWGRRGRNLEVIARLRPGVSQQQAAEEMSRVARRFQEQYPDAYPPESGWDLEISPLLEAEVGKIRPALLALLGAGALVLLITCGNLANLQLTRALERRRELAVRSALGATRGRVVRQFLTESTLLALIGGIPALLLAHWGLRSLVALAPPGIPRLDEVSLDARVFLFTFVVAALAGFLSGLLPALHASRSGLYENLKEGAGRSTGSLGGRRLRQTLVVAEVALSLVVLIGAGLLLRSFMGLQRADLGFDPTGLLTMEINLPDARYPEAPEVIGFFQRVLDGMDGLPGVSGAGLVSSLPLSGTNSSHGISFEGKQLPPGEVAHEVDFRSVSPGYFEVMRIPVAQGRAFRAADDAQSTPVVIVDELLAERFWPGESPVGRRLKMGPLEAPTPWMTIVGVVKHVQNQGADAGSDREQIYYPYPQRPRAGMTLVVRSASGDPMTLAGSVRDQVLAVDRQQPVSAARTMEDWFSDSLSRPRFSMLLLAVFAGVSLFLVVIGTYGVVSTSTAERTREIAIRMAMGAVRGDILRLLLSGSLILAGSGVGLGLLVAFAATRVLGGLLHGVSATDPLVFVAVPLLLAAVILLATYLPARRASRLQPVAALRLGHS